MLYIPKIKLDQTSQSIYFSRKKKLSRNGTQKISSLCPFNMSEAGMCILKKKYLINEIVFLVLIPNESYVDNNSTIQ